MATPVDQFHYELPPSLIAQQPLEQRDTSRMMVLRRGEAGAAHRQFSELPQLLPAGAAVVVNNTRVAPRRLRGSLPGGAPLDVLLLRPVGEGVWSALVRRARRLKPGITISLGGGHLTAEAVERDGEGHWLLRFHEPERLAERLSRYGLAPLPPYIRRGADLPGQDARDREAYQTCYASVEGAIAAPTAGLHFTPAVLGALERRGLERLEITLHVGLGTFTPIKGPDAELHTMQREWVEITEATAAALLAARRQGRPVVAVGTTTVRALESWALAGHPAGWAGWSGLFIRPPFAFRVVDGLLTNFHQPRSTLMMLVSAFHGREKLLAAYRQAIEREYRFFSFGDCMAILPAAGGGEG